MFVIVEFVGTYKVWQSTPLEDEHAAIYATQHLNRVYKERGEPGQFALFKLDEEGGLHEVRIDAEDPAGTS